MEEKISLALAVKLKKIYDRENQFLSFPMGLTFTSKSLEFMNEESELSTLERLHYKADFAHLMNQIPIDGPAVFTTTDTYLWNEIRDILINAEFEEVALSVDEEKQLADAIDFLVDEQVEPDGTISKVPSDKVKTYNVYKIAYEEANETYLAEQLTVENATGEEGLRLKAIWDSGREQELSSIRDQTMQDWINAGFKIEVEAHQMQRNILEVKKYTVIYRQNYLNDIKLAEIADVEAAGIPFCETLFNPRDAFDKEQPWIQVPLLKEELDHLIQQAPSEMKGIFSDGQGNEDIESLHLEYKYIGLKRSWFKPEFFQNRNWKLTDNSIVSDGGIPSQGRVPAYITGLLAVRNVTVTKKKDRANPDESANILPIFNRLPLQKMTLIKHLTVEEPTHQSVLPQRINMIKPLALKTFPQTVRLQDQVIKATTPIPVQNLKIRPFKSTIDAITVRGPLVKFPALYRPISQPKPDSDLITESYHFDGVVVLAFVCRRVAKSPNASQ